MVYIKKLVMQGFKSFVKKTEIPFSKGINIVLGPNGSGKSNISDALCFVLGRLSIKSMRAVKARNLIFLGTKKVAPCREAMVEIILDNSDKTFAIDKDEISLKRIVRRNGQSIYKINGETKTRQQVLTTLSQAGIDPNGFNIILQGEIQNFVKMNTEERRKIIEEVSGISIYESRKEKSLKELKKTEEKLKEVNAVLRERTSYLKNLEKDRQQALRYKKLEKNVKDYKASIINADLTKKKKQAEEIDKKIEQKDKEIERTKKQISDLKTKLKEYETKVSEINEKIQQSSGLEQEKLNQEIANLRADLAGLNVKAENNQSKLSNIQKQKQELEKSIQENKNSLEELKKESPSDTKKQKDIQKKQQQLEELEKNRKKFYSFKTEIKSTKERIEEKKKSLQTQENESDFLLKQIKSLTQQLFDKNTTKEKTEKIKNSIEEKKQTLESLNKKEIELEKKSSANEYEIDRQKKVIEDVSKLDICPLCKSKITREHIKNIENEVGPKIKELESKITSSDKELTEIQNKKKTLNQEIERLNSELSKRESDLIKLENINEKKEQIKIYNKKIEETKKELSELQKKEKNLEKAIQDYSGIEKKYENLQIEIQDISLRSKETIDSEISFKQKELDKASIDLKQLKRDEEEINEEITSLKKEIEQKNKTLEMKKKQEEELSKKHQKMIAERDSYQKKIREEEINLNNKNNQIHYIENEKNNIKVEKARINAEIENLEIEILEFPDANIIKSNKETLKQKLEKTQETLNKIGSVNLKSLETYESVKKEYEAIQEKANTIEKEKESILKVIHDIDVKKKKTFLKTLNELNEIFSRNFSQLSAKGHVFLELENRKDPFSGGVNIVVKTGHGKYFDVTSLSGGEQTLVALSLIFAIQELNPYAFYILDEIDAALDKRNSERLAGLLTKYMQRGQYIIVSHNDEVISNATTLYGVSMHDGISKITSLEV